MALIDRIREEIRSHGPLPFERFMALALYDADGGFFGSGPLRSAKSGDFLTSPEVSHWFGRTLAAAVGSPRTLVEVGAGSGSLLRPLVQSLPHRPDRVVAVDASPAARAALGDMGFETARDLAEVEETFSGAIVANERLDNLPMRLAARSGDVWVERWIGLDGDGLSLVEAPARSDSVAWLDAYAGKVPDGGVVEVQLEAASWLRRAIDLIASGVILVVDYGGTAVSWSRGEPSVRCARIEPTTSAPIRCVSRGPRTSLPMSTSLRSSTLHSGRGRRPAYIAKTTSW